MAHDLWSAGPSNIGDFRIDDTHFDDIRAAVLWSPVRNSDLRPLGLKYGLFLPNESIKKTRKRVLQDLRLLKSKVSLKLPARIGAPYLYLTSTHAIKRRREIIDYYAAQLDLVAPDLFSHSKYHYLRNEVCKVLGRDPLSEGEVDETLLECFKSRKYALQPFVVF